MLTSIVHIPAEINVRRIRKKLNMSQNTFADYFGVSLKTIQDWEEGRRMPSGASKNFIFNFILSYRVFIS